jgi:N-acetylglutamate synthase-like GNAT family acetyltransferase
VRIRKAHRKDVAAIVALVESAYRGESSRSGWTTEADLLDGQRTDPREVESLLEHIVVAEDDTGALLGCCTLVPREGHGYFGMFAVQPGEQGSGVGSRLLDRAEQLARERDLGYVELTVISTRQELLDYYLRRGYKDTGERRPFPYGDERFGRPKRDDLDFTVLTKEL